MPAVQLVEAYDQHTQRMTGTGPATFSSSISTSTSTAEPQRYYIDTDHLGTPQELTDIEGRLQWVGHYRAWGELVKANDSDGNAANVEMPLRFQGQYWDAETGLHYNRHRYYDPQLGRFTTQDPISLAGGINLYQYAPNPVGWVDPLGLSRRDDCSMILGGPHRLVQGVPGNESHHMPADSVSPLSKGRGPAISMVKEDHRQTASWGNTRAARSYREQQKLLIDQGEFKKAQQMDINDVKEKFGDKYDDNIKQMLEYTEKLGF